MKDVPFITKNIEIGHKSLYRLLPNHIYFDKGIIDNSYCSLDSSPFAKILIKNLYFNYPSLSQDDNPLIVTSALSLPAKNTKWSSITVKQNSSLQNTIPLSFERLPQCHYIFIQENSYNTILSLTISDLQQLQLLVVERYSFKKVITFTLNSNYLKR